MSHSEDQKEFGKQVKALFNQCLDEPVNAADIITNSSYSQAVKQRVEAMLSEVPKGHEMTEKVMHSVQASFDAQPLTVGMSVGQYQLLKPLGQGGQAEVWLAERKDGDFKHQVAIKFLKPLFDEADLLRFQSERSLLAQLKHPYIAQLLDGGELLGKRPYMVIELVNGVSVLEYGHQQQFSVKAYLECFIQVCEAVGYAHANSVIHRDIKPSNVMVTTEGDVKLLDFGIAKFLVKNEEATKTAPVLTLAYSSPEQLTGGTVSTATDVYAMGLLLYELLSGHQAQGEETPTPAEIIHEITHQSPVLPSSALAKHPQNRPYAAKLLQGDLDNVVMMAIRKEPDRRYPTVMALAQDIKNYLNNKPVVATGDDWWYTARKLLRRNPVSSLLALGLMLVLLYAQIMLLQKQNEITMQRDQALQAREQSERSNEFLINILESASPIAAQGQDVKLSDVLMTAERQLLHGLSQQDDLKAELLTTLARIHHSLGGEAKSVDYYQKALKLQQNPNQTIRTMGELAISQYLNENIPAAKNTMTEAKKLSKQISNIEVLGWHQAYMATMENFLGNHQYTRKQLPIVIEQLNKELQPNKRLLGRLYNELSLAYNYKNHTPEKAIEYSRKALSNAEQLMGTHHPVYVSRLMNLASILNGQSDSDEAESLLLQAAEIAATIYTENHPFYAQIIGELATTYHNQGRFLETEELYQKARIISAQLSGENSISHLIQLNNLAYLYEDMGQYEKAEPLYRQSLLMRQQHFSEVPRRLASAAINLARLLVKVKSLEEADRWLAYALTQDPDPGLKYKLVVLALDLSRQTATGDCQIPDSNFQTVLKEVEKLPPNHWRSLQADLWMGQLAFGCKELNLANKLLRQAKSKAGLVYKTGSDGQQHIYDIVNGLLSGH